MIIRCPLLRPVPPWSRGGQAEEGEEEGWGRGKAVALERRLEKHNEG